MAQIPKEEAAAINQNGAAANGGPAPEMPIVRGGAFSQAQESETPFGFGKVGSLLFLHLAFWEGDR